MARIRKRGKGYQIDYTDPNGKRVRKSFKKKKEAEAELGKRVSLIAEGRYLDVKKDCKITLGELVEKYEENYQDQKSYEKSKRFILDMILQHFGEDTRISNIKYVDLETYRNQLKRTVTKITQTLYTNATVNRFVSVLHHLYTKSVEWEMIEQSPFDRGKSLMLKDMTMRLRFLNQDEIERLLDQCGPYLHNVVTCAINTGMRKGEILKLRWSQIVYDQIYLTAADTKTSEKREIPLNDDMLWMLKELRKQNQLRSEYVFLKNGRRIKDIQTSFRSAVKRANIDDFRFHDLRHTFASQLIMKGGTLKEVQELLGHKDIKMTMRYAHLSQEHKKKAVNLLNGLTGPEAKSTCHKTVTHLKQAV